MILVGYVWILAEYVPIPVLMSFQHNFNWYKVTTHAATQNEP
jgi:hypothetical protein